ncbi:hypothetical protein DVH24_041726 [Malus domestica]|uniref:Ubiquitin-like protease family profile domain-containing protein n=1 Tax=Malus domestica TaxID=3750 RepID=A0A498IN37_MALDO|nr:hypothetical protein DVH24_041726 [Malus domestica]
MQLYRPMLQQRQDVINHLAETPFWSLIKFYMDDEIVATDRKKKSDMDLIKIIQCYDSKQQQKYNWAKGVRDYLFKRINKSKKKRKNGEESATTSGCTALILYWICLHTNLVETISGRENMIPAIGRWDITKIHKAIRDIQVEEIEIGGGIPCSEEPTKEHSNINQEECNVIPYPQQNNESSKKKEKKTTGRKRKRTEVGAEEDQSITITEAQSQFDQLYQEEFMKFDASYQKDFIGIDNTLGVEDFEKFKRCASMDQKRYLVLSHMMIYALDNIHTNSIVMNQTTGALNRNIEKLLQERLEDKQKISSMNTEMIQLQLNNTAASMKVNKLLDEIGSLKKKLLENQAIVPDLNASTKEDPEEDEPPKEHPDNDDQVEEHTHDKDTATEDPVQENATENDVAMEDPKQRHAIDHDPDENEEDQAEEDQEHEGKDTATEKGTFGSESQPLEPIIEKGKEEPKVESPLNPIAKEIANKPAKKAAKKPVKQKLDKRYHLPASTRAYKLLEDKTKEKFKEYYRQEKMDYFWMQPRQGSMATDLVVLKSDLTSLFVDGAIDANIIDASFYTMAENESKMRQQKNLYLPSFIFNDMEIEKSKTDQEHIDKTLKTVLQDNVDKVGKVFILIKHYFHFSLVVLDIKNGKMTHYNSKLPRVHGNTDLYFDHAVQVRDKIEAFYKDFKGDSNLTIDIERCLTCAQQKEDSLDCGIFVIQFATQVQEGKPIEATFEKEEVFAKRAQIATALVNHKNSYANGLKKILEDRRQQNKHGQYDDIPDEDFITLA